MLIGAYADDDSGYGALNEANWLVSAAIGISTSVNATLTQRLADSWSFDNIYWRACCVMWQRSLGVYLARPYRE